MDNEVKARMIEEQILHRLGYDVFSIPSLTVVEKKRLVEGYLMFESHGEYEDPQRKQEEAEKLIREREDGKSRRKY